jgi:putative transposase
MARYDLPDEAWTIIKPLLPPEPATRPAGRPWAEHRKIINGMFWVLCSGAPWRDLPERYGPWKTVYNRFNRWSKSGVINIIFNRLLSLLDANGFVDWSATALDGGNIRALKCAAGAQKSILISTEIMGWVALAAVSAPKSIWQQTEAVSR